MPMRKAVRLHCMYRINNWISRVNTVLLDKTMTFPVVGSWCSKHHIMVILGEGSCQALLAESKSLMASASALTQFPVSAILIRGRVDAHVLTEDVAAPNDVMRLLRGFHI